MLLSDDGLDALLKTGVSVANTIATLHELGSMQMLRYTGNALRSF